MERARNDPSGGMAAIIVPYAFALSRPVVRGVEAEGGLDRERFSGANLNSAAAKTGRDGQ